MYIHDRNERIAAVNQFMCLGYHVNHDYSVRKIEVQLCKVSITFNTSRHIMLHLKMICDPTKLHSYFTFIPLVLLMASNVDRLLRHKSDDSLYYTLLILEQPSL